MSGTHLLTIKNTPNEWNPHKCYSILWNNQDPLYALIGWIL